MFPTGVPGLDAVLGGGLPRGRNTVVVGGPGAGKTLLVLQCLSHLARSRDERGVVVAFEEPSANLLESAAKLSFNPRDLVDDRIALVDARLPLTDVQAGAFDLEGLLAVIGAHAERIGARIVAFDGIDVLLDFLDDPAAVRVELRRVHEWLRERCLTGIITAKTLARRDDAKAYGQLEYLADCVIALRQDRRQDAAVRNLQVLKVRGSGHALQDVAIVISGDGLELMTWEPSGLHHEVFTDRVSTGNDTLDAMLDGGYRRGSAVMVSGAPGTAKSTLGCLFLERACSQGARGLLVSFDESAEQIVRDQASVGTRLRPHLKSGRLRIEARRARSSSAHEHVVAIRGLLREHQPQCLVVDPISALLAFGGPVLGEEVSLWLIDLAKSMGITVLVTSLLQGAPTDEATMVGISTIADTWMHLSYVVHAGERNRALTIVKSRGTAHSNQVRELVLGADGVRIVEVYTAGGAVLMGTLRWEKEQELQRERLEHEQALDARRRQIELELLHARARRAASEGEIDARERELLALEHELRDEQSRQVHAREEVGRRRVGTKPLGAKKTKQRKTGASS